MSKMKCFKYCAPEGRRREEGRGGAPDGQTGLASQINPDRGGKRGSRLRVGS